MTDLLLVGHGSRDPGRGQGVRRAARPRRGSASEGRRVGGGFLELADPPIDDAVDALVADGADDVVAVPYVLFGAGHLKDDGPAVLGRARRRHPDVRFRLARDLGIHPAVLDVAEERARAALDRACGRPADDGRRRHRGGARRPGVDRPRRLRRAGEVRPPARRRARARPGRAGVRGHDRAVGGGGARPVPPAGRPAGRGGAAVPVPGRAGRPHRRAGRGVGGRPARRGDRHGRAPRSASPARRPGRRALRRAARPATSA